MKNRRNSRPMIGEKAKDFKKSIKRLISEQKKYRVLVIISLVLAALGSILTISTPDRLKDLTNEISKGLVVNTKNMEKLSTSIMINNSLNKTI